MTSKQRLLAAMHREQPDRVPIHMRGVHAWDDDWVAAQHSSYRPVIDAVRESCDAVLRPYAPGISSSLLTGAADDVTEVSTSDAGDWEVHRTTVHTPSGPLVQDYWVSRRGRRPLMKKYLASDPSDVERALSLPYSRPQVDLSEYFRLRGEHPDALVILEFPSPTDLAHELMGSETFAYWWVDHRDLLFRLRDAFQERVLDVLESLLDAGVGPVLGTSGTEFVAPPIHSPETYREFVLPCSAELARRLHERGCLLHVHCHNRLNALLEDFTYTGWDVLHPIEPPPMGDVVLADAKRRVGGSLCFEGNIQIGEIYASPTERVVALVEEAMAAGKPGGGFILCPTASPHTPMLSDLTVRNYLAMIETAVRLRDY